MFSVRALTTRARASRFILRAIAGALGVVLAIGGIPGARLHVAPADVTALTAPPVPPDVQDRDAVIDVTVRDRAGGRPLAGAHVRALAILDDRAYLAADQVTSDIGQVHLASLPRGEVWILADALDRARGSTHAVVDETPRAVTIDLSAAHALRALVKDEAGSPLEGAAIEVATSRDPLPVGARSGTDGVAEVGRLGAGPWRVTARAPGYDDATARAEQDGELVTLTLRKLGALAVHVDGGPGHDAAGARVELAGATLWPPRSARTNDHGDVRIGGLSAGIYALRATLGERVSAIELGVALARGEEKRVVLALAPGRMIGVRVGDGPDDSAGAIAGARVTLVEGGLSPFPLEATTDPKGRARLGPIGDGAATLGARADGFVPLGAVALADPAPAETRLSLVRSGTLTGRVVDGRGQPVGGATIEIAGTDGRGGPIFDDPRRARFQAAHFDAMLAGPLPLLSGGELGVMPGPVPPIPRAAFPSIPAPNAASPDFADPWVTRSDGTFRATPASPGRVRAIVHHPQYVEAESEIVTLAPGGEAEVEIVMREGGVLEGRVLDAHDAPAAGARVFVSATRGTLERTTRTAADGTFAFAALPESVSVSASAGDDDALDVRSVFAIPEGGHREVTLRLPEAREALSVSVVDARGFFVDAAQVSASSLSPQSPLRTTAFTDANGEARLKHARGLPLRIEVRAPAHAPCVIATDGASEAVRIELAAAESAAGEVSAARGGDPIAGAEITLYTDLGARRTRTDAHGAFSLSELGAGGARLRVRAPGFAPVTSALTIPEDGGRRPYPIPPVTMNAEAMVEGEVIDARGDPVPGARVAKDHVPTWLLVGSNPNEVAVTDARGRFTLRELPEGMIALEAYAPDVGRSHDVTAKTVSDRTTTGVRMVIAPDGPGPGQAARTGDGASVAITLGETGAPVEVVVVSVLEASEADRAGIAPGDVLLSVDDTAVTSMDQARALLSGPIANDVLLRMRRGDRGFVVRAARDPLRR